MYGRNSDHIYCRVSGMKREYKLFLDDIVENIDKIQRFVSGMSFDDFRKDDKTIYAVSRSLEIIGESVSQIPDEVRDKYDDIPWRDIKNFRNQVVHKYWDVDVEIVWDIVKNELDELKSKIKGLISAD